MIKRLLALLTVLALAASVHAATETYAIDPVHSSVSFSVRHLVSKFTGGFTKVSGTIQVDRASLENSSVEAAIEVGSVNTANDKRNGHVLSADFLDAAKFPTITFKSKSWKKTGEDTYEVTGDLTLKGVTKETVLHVAVLGFAPGMKPGTTTSGWEITATLNRQNFGVTYGPKIIGDDVSVTIGVEANHEAAK